MLKVKLVPARNYSVDVEHTLIKNLRMKVGPTIAIEIEKANEILADPMENSGRS